MAFLCNPERSEGSMQPPECRVRVRISMLPLDFHESLCSEKASRGYGTNET
jgi:hypothetical protein